MGSGRSIDGNSQRAYRVVRTTEYTRTTTKQFYGPYSTLAAAKGKRTTLVGNEERWPTGAPVTIEIEQTPEGWEKVEV